jgi:hypothetical protein
MLNYAHRNHHIEIILPHTANSIKVVPEQSGKVESAKGCWESLINEWIY